jgi:hypothetical protein
VKGDTRELPADVHSLVSEACRWSSAHGGTGSRSWVAAIVEQRHGKEVQVLQNYASGWRLLNV